MSGPAPDLAPIETMTTISPSGHTENSTAVGAADVASPCSQAAEAAAAPAPAPAPAPATTAAATASEAATSPSPSEGRSIAAAAADGDYVGDGDAVQPTPSLKDSPPLLIESPQPLEPSPSPSPSSPSPSPLNETPSPSPLTPERSRDSSIPHVETAAERVAAEDTRLGRVDDEREKPHNGDETGGGGPATAVADEGMAAESEAARELPTSPEPSSSESIQTKHMEDAGATDQEGSSNTSADEDGGNGAAGTHAGTATANSTGGSDAGAPDTEITATPIGDQTSDSSAHGEEAAKPLEPTARPEEGGESSTNTIVEGVPSPPPQVGGGLPAPSNQSEVVEPTTAIAIDAQVSSTSSTMKSPADGGEAESCAAPVGENEAGKGDHLPSTSPPQPVEDGIVREGGGCGGDEAEKEKERHVAPRKKGACGGDLEEGSGVEAEVDVIAPVAKVREDSDEDEARAKEGEGLGQTDDRTCDGLESKIELQEELLGGADRGVDKEGPISEVGEGSPDGKNVQSSTECLPLPLQETIIAPGSVVVVGAESGEGQAAVEATEEASEATATTAKLVAPEEEISRDPAAPSTATPEGDSPGDHVGQLEDTEAAGSSGEAANTALSAAPARATLNGDVDERKEEVEATDIVTSNDSRIQEPPSAPLPSDPPLPEANLDPSTVEETMKSGADLLDVPGAGTDANPRVAGSDIDEISPRGEDASDLDYVDSNACSTAIVGAADAEQVKATGMADGTTPDANRADPADVPGENSTTACPAEVPDMRGGEEGTIQSPTVASFLATGEEKSEDLTCSVSAGSKESSRTAGEANMMVSGSSSVGNTEERLGDEGQRTDVLAEAGLGNGSAETAAIQEEGSEIHPVEVGLAQDGSADAHQSAPDPVGHGDVENGGKDGTTVEAARHDVDEFKGEEKNNDESLLSAKTTESGELCGSSGEVSPEISRAQAVIKGEDNGCFEAFDEMSSSAGGAKGAESSLGGGVVSGSLDGPGTSLSLEEESIGGASGSGNDDGGDSLASADAGKVPAGLVGVTPQTPSIGTGGG